MTYEESLQLKKGDLVKITGGSMAGLKATIPWMDRLYIDEPIPVRIDYTEVSCYHIVRFENLEFAEENSDAASI